ncbi:MAG: NACHT domain-containing protein [Anaerolineae bacterium]|nr:NACHT domain-containing protein [Anaerolineae bacterium]
MPPIDTTVLTTIFTWVWSTYGKTVVDKTSKAAWERLRWEDRALAYGQKVQRLYGTIQLLGQPRPISLEGIYTAVSLLDRPEALRRYTVEEMQAEFEGRGRRYFHTGGKEKRRDGLEMVRRGQNLFILGKPGAGKTTFLKHVALRGVKGDIDRVPIFVGLKQLSDSGKSVFDYIVGEFDVCNFPDAAGYLDRLLKSGKALLLFDGLDEVNVADDERKHLIAGVETFTRKYDLCPRLITCRLAANDYLFQGYTYVEMADFDEGQIREFVARWFSGDERERERRELFLSELENTASEGLRELARVPLLLALLCLSFEERLTLSSRRVELYGDALNALLKKWDSSRNIRRDEVYRELSPKRKLQMLSRIAAETFGRAEYFIHKRTLVRAIEDFLSKVPDASGEVDGEVVLQSIIAQHGLFLERAGNIFSFVHLTIHEYFAARYVVENSARGTLPLLINNYDDSRYKEVFLMTAGQLQEATEFFNLFANRLTEAVAESPTVAALLRHVARKAAPAADNTMSAVAVRSTYLSIALYLDQARDFTLARTQDIGLGLPLITAQNRALENDLVFAFGIDYPFNIVDERTLNNALTVANANTLFDTLGIVHKRAQLLKRSPHAVLARDLALAKAQLSLGIDVFYYWHGDKGWYYVLIIDFLEAAISQSRALKDTVIANRLAGLITLVNSAATGQGPVTEKVFTELDAVFKVLNLDFPDLEENDWEFIYKYEYWNKLLLSCLEQAAVADREAIKARLLLLPES